MNVNLGSQITKKDVVVSVFFIGSERDSDVN